jgi:hypothetical protein
VNYFLGSAPLLPAFIHELLEAEGEDVHAQGAMRICTLRGRFFLTRPEPVTVGSVLVAARARRGAGCREP